MNYNEFKLLFNFELPSYAEKLYDEFIDTYDDAPVLSMEQALLVAYETGLPCDAKEALKECARIINENDTSRLCANFIKYITVKKRAPWQNYIYTDDLFSAEGLQKEQIGWVIVASALADTIINKKPPKDLNAENLNAFRGYSNACYGKNGYWGILEWNWNMLCAGGCMFLFGILKFVPGEFGGDFRVITDGKRYVSLCRGEFFVDKNGSLTDKECDSVYKTTFYEDGNKFIGCRVSARGRVECGVSEFSKKQWRDFLREGTHTLDIHIPSKIEYTPENIKEACRKAIAFYNDFYPDFHPAAIVGYSWIFSPQLEKVFDNDSNILRVNRSIYIMPTIGEFGHDCRFIREGSTLQKRVFEEQQKGTRFHYGAMFSPINEIDTFGKETE